MVLKVGKHGVRSGNSIKVPSVKYLRQYKKESVLVRNHITNGEKKDNGVESFLADDAVHCNSVPYSLNKKCRWTLPEQIRENILYGDHAGEEFGIQLVERHKLCKQAGCIGVCSTQTKFKRKRKGYLDEKTILKARPASGISRKRRQELIRRGLPIPEDDSDEYVDEPDQIRYDVLYPCPTTSSITYTNPKFQTPANENGLRNKGGKQRHRQKFADEIEDSLEFMDSVFDDSEEEDSFHDDGEGTSPVARTTECLLEDILRHAENANKLVTGKTTGKRYQSRSYHEKENASKSHIVFEKSSKKAVLNEDVPEPNYSDTVPATKTPEIMPVLVILSTEQLDPQNLKYCFGDNYIECDCFPRKFVIDISKTVSDHFLQASPKKPHVTNINAGIVFIHDVDNEINNPKESVVKVFLNTNYNSNQQSVKIETIFDYVETTVSEVIERTVFYIETLPHDAIEFNTEVSPWKTTSQGILEELAHWNTVSYKPNDRYLFQNFVKSNSDDHTASELNFEVVSRFDSFYAAEETTDVTSPKDRFCSVCFELLGSGISGTALISCGHWFCDNCWTEHLRTRVCGGSLRLECPEYDCDKLVDPGTALTLLKVRDIIKYARVCHDTQVEQTATRIWCPNERCGRVLEASKKDVRIAQCSCGRRVCLRCLGSAHWPAPCKSASVYNEKLIASGHSGIKPCDAKTNTVSVHGKCCPNCNRFVEKDGGCPYMACVCGKPFCWGCGRDYKTNTHTNCHFGGAFDRHRTVKKNIKPEVPKIPHNEKHWYTVAVRHRLKQHPENIKELETASKGLSKQIRRHMMRAEQNGEIIALNFDMPHKKYANENNKVPDFLRNTIDLYREINNIVENAMVLIDANSSEKVRMYPVKHIVHRLSVFADDIFDIFVHGVQSDHGTFSVKSLVQKLIDVRYYSRITIQGLVKRIKMAEL